MSELAQIYQDLWQALTTAVSVSKHGFHTGVLITANNNIPDGRTVVLRHVDPQRGFIHCHVDYRSPKALAIQQNPRVAFCFYAPDDKLQLRLQATAKLHYQDAVAEAAWQASAARSQACYSNPYAPTTPLPNAEQFPPVRDNLAGGYRNFAVVRAQISHIDWYYLSSQGHRRAGFTLQPDSGALQHSQWLAP